MALEDMKCEVMVTLPSNTPVVGCEIKPNVRVKAYDSLETPQHSLIFNWFREQTTCSVHRVKIATIQCMSCVTLRLPVKESYHCSTKCFSNAWKSHLTRHQHAAETVCKTSYGDDRAVGKLRSCGSWPTFGYGSLFAGCSTVVEREGKTWIEVGSSKNYVPSMDDFGINLRLESVAVDSSTGIPLSPINTTVTVPVIIAPDPRPRCMIQIGHLKISRNFNFEAQFSNAGTFSVLSYNILSDLYARGGMYSHCPTWALAWEYRRQNLLQEIIGYDADILCLQEVYTANQYIIDGCATFYRHDQFKEIVKYELEFDKTARSVVDALEPGQRARGSIRLMKDNVALVVILEIVNNRSIHDAFRSRICVANTHIHANSNFPDVKLCQTADLINELEKIAQFQIPLLICGDMNSLPGSDPHAFVVSGTLSPIHGKKTDPLGIYQHLKLSHSIPLVSAYASLLLSGKAEERERRKIDCRTMEPFFTHFTPTFLGTLDYIFYTADRLKVEALLELLDAESVGSGLPSPLWSSDHIAIMASFSIRRPSTQ